jgi:NADH-quinone oxidoreductase subunit C
MNDMKEHLIDLNLIFISYINILVEALNFKYFYSFFLKYFQLVCILNQMTYYINILNFKDFSLLKFLTLSDYSALHYPGGLYEFEVNYLLLSYRLNFKCFLRLFVNKDDLVLSINEIYSNSNWLEREIWDLFGILYIYHTDLRRILTDYGFVGHPLLKYFPLIGFTELRFDDCIYRIVKEVVEMTQAFRKFNFFNPWIEKKYSF